MRQRLVTLAAGADQNWIATSNRFLGRFVLAGLEKRRATIQVWDRRDSGESRVAARRRRRLEINNGHQFAQAK